MLNRVCSSWAGPVLALLLVTTGAVTSQAKDEQKTRPVCCANHPASHAKCCKAGTEAACCHGGKAPAKGVTAVCAITGKPLKECCGSKASQTPPCCQKGCKHAGHKER
jgi:hypothetical protein